MRTRVYAVPCVSECACMVGVGVSACRRVGVTACRRVRVCARASARVRRVYMCVCGVFVRIFF